MGEGSLVMRNVTGDPEDVNTRKEGKHRVITLEGHNPVTRVAMRPVGGGVHIAGMGE